MTVAEETMTDELIADAPFREEVIRDAGAALDAAASSVADTVLTDADRRFLSHRPRIEDATALFDKASKERAEQIEVVEAEKKTLKALEAAWEAATLGLRRALTDEPVQLDLFKEGNSATPLTTYADDPEYVAAHKTWEAMWDDFLAGSIDQLDVPDGIKTKLREHSPDAVETLKALTDLKKNNPVRGYCTVKGIGEEKADSLDNAFEKLVAEFMAANPEPKKAEPANDAPQPSASADFDFISTFPAAIDLTQNETPPDAEYHRHIINTAIQHRTELVGIKDRLEANVELNGTPLAKNKRVKLETAQGETQIQYDEGYDAYADKFGKPAAETLRRYVEKEVGRKADLKGGLE